MTTKTIKNDRWTAYKNQIKASKNPAMTRFRVLDLNDKFCGHWYAKTEVEAITLAIEEGYDAWSVDTRPPAGW